MARISAVVAAIDACARVSAPSLRNGFVAVGVVTKRNLTRRVRKTSFCRSEIVDLMITFGLSILVQAEVGHRGTLSAGTQCGKTWRHPSRRSLRTRLLVTCSRFSDPVPRLWPSLIKDVPASRPPDGQHPVSTMGAEKSF